MPWGEFNLGGTSLNYRVISAASYAALPSAPAENTIGLITSTAVKDVYVTNETVSGMVDGDVVIRHGSRSNTVLNILQSGRHDMYLSGAYQRQSGVLVSIESYLYTSGAWKRIYVLFYENNTFPAVVGDFVVQTAGSLTKAATYMDFQLSAQAGWARSQNLIDLTRINTLYFYGAGSHATVSPVVEASVTAGGAAAAAASLPHANAYAWTALNVASLTGDHYIRFGYSATTVTFNTRCYVWYGLS